MRSAKTVIGYGIVALGIASATVLFLRSGERPHPQEDVVDSPPVTNPIAEVAQSTNAAPISKKIVKKKTFPAFKPLFSDLPEKERKLCESIQAALDDENFAKVQELTKEAMSSALSEVRQQAVEALGWFGEKALPELTPLMGDRDENVARAAMDAWELALADVEKASERVSVAKLALTTITDPDALAMIGGQFSSAASEFVDAAEDDETALKRRTEVVQTVVDMIGNDEYPTRAKAAGEIYEEITGHAWISIDEAEKYLRDPDNYEPPEDRTDSE